MKLNQTWEMGELIDLSGEIRDGARFLDPPYPPVRIQEIDLRPMAEGWEYLPYTQEIHLPVQAATYLETAAHLYPEREKIDEVGLERLFVPAVVLQIPRKYDEKIGASDIQAALGEAREEVRPGDALLIATGYDRFSEPDGKRSPHFSYDAVEWVVQHQCSILGSDMSNWQDPAEKPSFFPLFFQSDTLLLAPMVNLTRIPVPRIRLIVLPLKIRGVCASPCRAIGVVPPLSEDRRSDPVQ